MPPAAQTTAASEAGAPLSVDAQNVAGPLDHAGFVESAQFVNVYEQSVNPTRLDLPW